VSGYTRVTHRGEFFELALTTPNMNFATDPLTGESPEADYHARAKERFERIFTAHAAFIRDQMTTFRDEFAGRATFPSFDSAKTTVSFQVGTLSVSVAFGSAPAPALHEAMQQRLRALFMLGAQLVTRDYQVTLEAEALGDDEPAKARAELERTLAEARPDLDATVTALRDEQEQILPYDASLPMGSPGEKRGACRFDFRIDVPRGAALILTLAAAPTHEEWLHLCARLQALQLDQLRRKNARAEPRAGRGWFSWLFK
jgi:hypothetical protein